MSRQNTMYLFAFQINFSFFTVTNILSTEKRTTEINDNEHKFLFSCIFLLLENNGNRIRRVALINNDLWLRQTFAVGCVADICDSLPLTTRHFFCSRADWMWEMCALWSSRLFGWFIVSFRQCSLRWVQAPTCDVAWDKYLPNPRVTFSVAWITARRKSGFRLA